MNNYKRNKRNPNFVAIMDTYDVWVSNYLTICKHRGNINRVKKKAFVQWHKSYNIEEYTLLYFIFALN